MTCALLDAHQFQLAVALIVATPEDFAPKKQFAPEDHYISTMFLTLQICLVTMGIRHDNTWNGIPCLEHGVMSIAALIRPSQLNR